MGLLVLLIYVYVFGMSETHSLRFNKDDVYGGKSPITLNEDAGPLEQGQAIYHNYCSLCHGNAGDAGLEGASDLTLSTLSDEETLAVIREGRKTMKAFHSRLSEAELLLVRDYVMTLRVE